MTTINGRAIFMLGAMVAAVSMAAGCAADANGRDDPSMIDESTAATAEALHNGGHCTLRPSPRMFGGDHLVFRADAKWDAAHRRLRVSLSQGANQHHTTGPHNNVHASLYAKGGGWVDTYDSPDDMKTGASRLFTLKPDMKPHAGDHLDVDVAWDTGLNDLHCHIKLIP